MHCRTLIKLSRQHHHRKHYHHQYLGVSLSLLFFCSRWLQETPIILSSALYLTQSASLPQPPQVPPELAGNGVMQALSQFVAQQVANGSPPGSLQVDATTSPNGAISIQQQQLQMNPTNIGLVNANNVPIIINQSQNQNNQNSSTSNAAQQSAIMVQPQQLATGSNTNQFIIKWNYNNPQDRTAYVSIVPVNYTNLHEPRIELRYQSRYPFVSLPESSLNNTVVAAVMVQDDDHDGYDLSIEQGNELGHFKLFSTGNSNTIQVNGAPLSRQRVPEYNLTIVARDHGTPPKASRSNLVIKLYPSPNSAPHSTQQAQLESQPSLKPPVTDLMYVGTMLVLMFVAVVILIIFGCVLVQRPQRAAKHVHKAQPPSRTTSASNSRFIPPPDQCSAYCVSSRYSLTNL